MDTTEREKYPMGTALTFQGADGFIVGVRKNESESFTIGGGGMKPVVYHYKVLWVDKAGAALRVSETPDNILDRFVKDAAQYDTPPLNPDHIPQMIEQAEAHQNKEFLDRQEASKKTDERRAAYYEEIKPKIPSWAKAVIIGELEIDKCDSMTDYYATTSQDFKILAFSKHNRDLFPEMRAAALNCEETAYLHGADEKAEHREKYSMGAGYYLKDEGRYSTGWKVSKQTFWHAGEPWRDIPIGEWKIPEKKAGHHAPRSAEGGIVEAWHTKENFQMFIVLIPGERDRDEFNRLRNCCKEAGGWYSRKWGTTPGGFAFTEQDKAEAFQQEHFQDAEN